MKDQVESLNERGILRAASLFGYVLPQEMNIALDNAIYGDYKFFISPERLRTEIFRVRVAG